MPSVLCLKDKQGREPAMAQPLPEAIREWLQRERAWKSGLDPNGCTTIAFTPLPESRTQLVTPGLPNTPEKTQVPAVFTECQLKLDRGPWEVHVGRVYVVRGHAVQEGTLILPQQSPKAIVAQVVNGMEDATQSICRYRQLVMGCLKNGSGHLNSGRARQGGM